MNLELESTERLLRMRDDFRASSQTRKAIEQELARRVIVLDDDTETLPLFGNELENREGGEVL
jgi:hypothetical protein